MIRGKARTVLTAIVIVFVIVIGIFGTREPSVTVNDGKLKISGLHGITLGIDEIQEIKEITEDKIPVGSKILGIDIGDVRKGRFHYGDNSSAKVFLESSSGPYIFITIKDDIIIMNFKKSDKTKEVFNYLKETIKK